MGTIGREFHQLNKPRNKVIATEKDGVISAIEVYTYQAIPKGFSSIANYLCGAVGVVILRHLMIIPKGTILVQFSHKGNNIMMTTAEDIKSNRNTFRVEPGSVYPQNAEKYYATGSIKDCRLPVEKEIIRYLNAETI